MAVQIVQVSIWTAGLRHVALPGVFPEDDLFLLFSVSFPLSTMEHDVSSPAHTSGPWRLDPDTLIIRDSANLGVAKVVGTPSDREVLANAHVLAAAPELLDVCRLVLKRIPASDLASAKRIKDTIAKAEGRA